MSIKSWAEDLFVALSKGAAYSEIQQDLLGFDGAVIRTISPTDHPVQTATGRQG